jgi:hypothetical protein
LRQRGPSAPADRLVGHSYVIDPDGKLTVDLTYPDHVDIEEIVTDRRPRAVEKYFGDVNVIQPDPFA